ncbi:MULTISPECIES: competence type IV pilus minor pilin ComGF [Bacillaceae]|uniref:competence type IV pilus minor pilin ComGF n=1 Tax=Bacillaceae TaxID=186817 RepID=UPI001CC1F2BF|nr:competence type IV pilus minor pilin ComGF [Bacillus sp. S3]
MKKLVPSRNAKFVVYSNERAFTLIEVLIAFSIFSTIIFFMSPIFQILLNTKSNDSNLQAMEWEVFSSQIKKEVRLASRADVSSGRLILTKGSEIIQIEVYGTNIRRRVNSTGHEIMLQNVSQSSFSVTNNVVKINVTDIRGKEYAITCYPLINWNAGQ